jgi:tetratricopeptide (TPR) repeat protein
MGTGPVDSLSKVGDVRGAQGDLDAALSAYEEGLKISRALTVQDPANAEWARDLSVSLSKVGDVYLDQGGLDAALSAYEEGLKISRTLTAQDRANTEWARDLSVSLNKVGDVRRAQGDLDAALSAYEEDLKISRALVARDPTNAEWARDLWVSLWGLAEADPSKAAAYWAEVVERMEAMQANGTLRPTDRQYLDFARSRLP